MIGSITLIEEEIKKIITNYFTSYKNINVYFKQPSEKDGTGIVVSHLHQIKNDFSLKLEEELEINDIKEIFTHIFNEEGYETTYVQLNKKNYGNGYGESTLLKSITIRLRKKEKIKQKTL